MRTTADLNRIIDKLAENSPARFDAPPSDRAEVRDAQPPKSDAANNAEPDSRPFVPRLADNSDSSATPKTRSARTRRRTPDSSLSSLASLSPSCERVKSPKQIDKTGKLFQVDADRRASKEVDEEAKRTQRRRQIDPTTCERDYSTEEIEFMKALDDYKRASGRMFPTCSEILEVFKSLGYVKTARAQSTDEPPQPNVQPNRAATPAFLNDEENDAFEFNGALVPGVA